MANSNVLMDLMKEKRNAASRNSLSMTTEDVAAKPTNSSAREVTLVLKTKKPVMAPQPAVTTLMKT